MRLLQLLCIISVSCATPIVMLHGILSSSYELKEAEHWFRTNTYNRVFNIEIGNGEVDSVFRNMSWQISQFEDRVRELGILEFHFIGFSQGGLIGRGFLLNNDKYRIKTFMTFGTPHMGVYYPYYDDSNIFNKQDTLSFPGYWKNPYNYSFYLNSSTFLPYINGDNRKLDNFKDVDQFVVVWSPDDGTINPVESTKFEYYDIDTQNIVPFLNSTQYIDNLCGLKRLDIEKRLHIFNISCHHTEFKTTYCLNMARDDILPYLI